MPGSAVHPTVSTPRRRGTSPDMPRVVRVELPIDREAALPAPEPRRGAAVAPSPAVAQGARSLKILLVEDNPDIREFLALVLNRRGHEVTTAESLSKARAAAAERDFHLLISDIELPDGTGLELMRELGGGRTVAGIALSGFGSKEDVEMSRRAGFAAHLTKPLDVRKLEATIARLGLARAACPLPAGVAAAD